MLKKDEVGDVFLNALHRPTALYLYFIFTPAFPLGRVTGTAALRCLDIPDGFQLLLIIPLAPHQDGAKQGRGCNRAT